MRFPTPPPITAVSDHTPSGCRTIRASSHASASIPTPVTPMSSQRSPEKLDHAAPKLRT